AGRPGCASRQKERVGDDNVTMVTPRKSLCGSQEIAKYASGGSVEHHPGTASGKSTRHPAGVGDTADGYLRGSAGGETHPNYFRTGRSRGQVNYRERTPKAEPGWKGRRDFD